MTTKAFEREEAGATPRSSVARLSLGGMSRREGQCSQVNDLGSQVDASQVDCWI